jgi:sn1-specific diacylglycerol lipase
MPALYLFHRRTILGGDDLQPAAFFTATLRLVQLLCLLLPIFIHVLHEIIKNEASSPSSSSQQQQQQQQEGVYDENDDDDFNDNDGSSSNSNSTSSSSCLSAAQSGRLQNYNHYYLVILFLYTTLSSLYNITTLFLLERPLSYWSSVGSPTDTQVRNQHVAQLLEFKLLYASILLFALWILGVLATALAPYYYHCQSVLLRHHHHSQWSNRFLEDGEQQQDDETDVTDDASSGSDSTYKSSHRYYWTMLAPTIILLVTQLAEVIVSWTYLMSLCAQPREDFNVNASFGSLVPLQHHDVPLSNQQMRLEEDDFEDEHDALPELHPRRLARHASQSSIPTPPPTVHHELVEEMWAERCANLCQCLGMASCFCFGGRDFHHSPHHTAGGGAGARSLIGHSEFGEIARALADYLETRGVLDIVPSDIVTGFLVLQQLQKQRILAARRAVLNDLSSLEEIGLAIGDGATTTAADYRQNSLLMGSSGAVGVGASNSSSSSTCSNADGNSHHAHYHHRQHNQQSRDILSNDIVSGPVAASAAAASAANDTINDNEDASLFVPLESPPASVNCHKNQNVYQRSSQKSSTSGNGIGSTTTTMAYHLASTLRATPATASDQQQCGLDVGGGGLYQAFSSPTSAPTGRPGGSSVDARAAEQACRSAARILLQRNNFTDMLALEEGARYAKYALAIYTWVLYLYVNPMTGVFRLAGHAACSACSSSSNSPSDSSNAPTSPGDPRIATSTIDESGRIEGDNLCHTHRSALLLAAGGLPTSALVYAQLKSRFNQNPYCILLDHEWRNVVVSIRGTFSLEDCITDVLIEPESLEKLGNDFGFDATNQYCHGGVFACARNIYRDLERHGLLDQLLLPCPSGTAPARYPDYSLRLVGHSLGSATCTLLSFLLRPKFPNLKVLNYCPVGCCVTWEMATACQDWCTSFVLDSDIVPRLSVESMEVLRDEILDLIARIKVNKVEVAKRLVGGGGGSVRQQKSSFFNWCFDFPADNDDFDDIDNNNDPNSNSRVEDLLYPPDQVPDTDYTRRLAQFKAIQEERRSTRALRVVKLYPPGKIIHLVKTGEQRACIHGIAKCLTCCTTNVGFVYTPVWINNDDLDEIVVNPHMGTDHFPNRIASVLENVAKEFGLHT